MNWNNWIRQTHRWLSVAFTLLVLVNILVNVVPLVQATVVPLVQATVVLWVGLATLLPLFLLLFSGVYLFVLPYTAKWGSG
jgi:hypothetical protein